MFRNPYRRLALYSGLLVLLFLPVLTRLVQLADVDLHSHVVLIPFISGYLIWQRRTEERGERRVESGREGDGGQLAVGSSQVPEAIAEGGGMELVMYPRTPNSVLRGPTRVLRSAFCVLRSAPITAFLGLMGGLLAVSALLAGNQMAVVDKLALQTAGFLCLTVAGTGWCLGSQFLRRNAFALAFLVFMIPMPTVVEYALEIFFQNASAEAAYGMFQLTGTTVLRTGRTFELPGLTIEVAQECSGIRSSYVLFMVSLLAGHLLLQRPISRWFITLFVIPLGIVRNGFRILTISLLTIHWDPGVIHSPLHHRGGPVFFALSLIPMFGVLWGLRWWERRRGGCRDSRQESAERRG